MQTGKLPPALLERYVLSRQGRPRPEVLVPAALGEDSSILDLEGDLCVLSADPITGSGSEVGRLAVHVACNDVAASGGEPVGILLTVLVPVDWQPEDIGALMEQAHTAACEVGVQIIGGHTEVTPGLPQAIVAATVVGRATRGRLITSSGLAPGAEIIVTKGVGLEGTAIFALDFAAELRRAGVAEETIAAAARLARRISVVPEARIAAAQGATAMHDVTEGGVLGALYEFASASRVGLRIELAAMPVLPETRAVCTALGADPLRLIGSGALLIGTPPERSRAILAALQAAGIMAAVVARALPASEGMCLVAADGKLQPLEPPESDELWRVKARLEGNH